MKVYLMKLIFNKIQLNRNELSGAFGDIGTDLPLIVAMLAASDLKAGNILILFGALQIITSLIYGLPMPVQPLKAVAMIVITQKISSAIIFGGGMAIGILMLLLTLTGLLSYLHKMIPKTVIRGIQFGLGLQLGLLALKEYVPAEHTIGYILAILAFGLGLVLLGNRKYPPALFILGLGLIYALIFHPSVITQMHLHAPDFSLPTITTENLWTGLLILALPQIPLSLGNSIFATHQLVKDFFPEKTIKIKRIGLTYSLMNIFAAFAGGIPVCHGSGGIAGHYTFGARTGGSTFIYGLFYILLGFFLSLHPSHIFSIFPKPILGIILLFEGVALILVMKDIITNRKNFFIATIVGLMANGIPYGYLIGMIVGAVLFYLPSHWILRNFSRTNS